MSEEMPYYESEIYKETCEEVDNADGYDDLIKDIIWYKQRIAELEKRLEDAKTEKAREILESKLNKYEKICIDFKENNEDYIEDWDEFDEYYVTSKIDIEFNKFIYNVKKLAKNEIKKLSEQNEKDRIYLQNRIKELNEKEKELREKEKELDERKSNIVLDFLKDKGLDKGFKPNQEVYYIDKNYKRPFCYECNGKGNTYKEIDGEIYTKKCTICNGTGTREEVNYLILQGIIDEINFQFYAKESIIKEDYFSNWEYTSISIKNKKNGCVKKINIQNIFLTEQEAQERIKELENKDSMVR